MLDSLQIKNPKSKIQNQTNQIRILLWDIDGTLMQSTRAGAYKEYFAPALEKVYGSAGRLVGMQVSGMTDTQIAFEALRDEGFMVERIFAEKERLLDIFKEEMSRVISIRDNPYKMFPGVSDILAETDKNPRYLNALLTGNLSVAAEIKLRYIKLWKYFENSPNIYGEISHDRRELARDALSRVKKFLGAEIKPQQLIVIGDTPNDIACAQAIGAKVISVATGRNHPREELMEYKPDVLLDDLQDTKKVLEIFRNL